MRYLDQIEADAAMIAYAIACAGAMALFLTVTIVALVVLT